MKKRHLLKHIIVMLIVVAVLASAQFFYVHVYKVAQIEATHTQVENYINQDLQYAPELYDQQLQELLDMADLMYINDSDKGHIYERAAQIYKFKEDTAEFYHFMGKALYHLEKGGNKSIAVNIYEDIANYYISESNYEQAREMLEKAHSICGIEEIDDPQVRSYAYRMESVMARHDDDFDKASDYISRSNEVLRDQTETFWYESYVAINDIQSAAIALEKGDLKTAGEYLDRYQDSSLFETPYYADIMTRDFCIPYYDTAAKRAAREGDIEELKMCLGKLESCCEKYGFDILEMDTIQDLRGGDYKLPDSIRKMLETRMLNLYPQIVLRQSENYAELINTPLNNGIEEQRNMAQAEQESRQRNRLIIIEVVIGLFVLYFLYKIVLYTLTDALTGIGNRRALNLYLRYLRFRGLRYYAIMMDVDNFKRVNDTYGHATGDDVLMRLGFLLHAMKSSQNSPFRYGGEEFVMIVRVPDLNMVLRLAENIRHDMEMQEWSFPGRITISLGVADSRQNKDAVGMADENMYHSKTNGKNAVSYTRDGEMVIFSRG